MNRAERRRLAKKGVTSEDLKFIYQTTKDEAIKLSVKNYTAAFALVLRDKWGFGETRMKRILGQIQEQFDAINQGYVNCDDIIKVLSEECNILIE